ERYFDLARRTLAEDGVFFSLNAHGKAGVERPSDYPLDGWQVQRMTPVRRFPWQVFATVPNELVLSKSNGVEVTPELLRRFDAIAQAMQLGLPEELEPWADALTSGGSEAALDALPDVFDDGDKAAKRAAIEKLGAPAVEEYLAGSLQFASGDLEAARL